MKTDENILDATLDPQEGIVNQALVIMNIMPLILIITTTAITKDLIHHLVVPPIATNLL